VYGKVCAYFIKDCLGIMLSFVEVVQKGHPQPYTPPPSDKWDPTYS
jgi:hypothetical protein